MIGLDISNRAVEIGSRAITKEGLSDSIYLIKGDAENLPFQNRSFDFVASNATLNLLPDKERGFHEIARVAKDGSMIVIADCIAKEDKRCCQGNDDELWSACVAGAPTKIEFQELAQKAGLEIIKTMELTEEVTRLVKNKLWDWPEFLEYELDYYVFGMRKGG